MINAITKKLRSSSRSWARTGGRTMLAAEGHHLLSKIPLAGIAQAEDGKLMTPLLRKWLASTRALLLMCQTQPYWRSKIRVTVQTNTQTTHVWILLSQDLKALQPGSHCGSRHPCFAQRAETDRAWFSACSQAVVTGDTDTPEKAFMIFPSFQHYFNSHEISS